MNFFRTSLPPLLALCVTLLAAALAPASAAEAANAPATPAKRAPILFVCGDSTAAPGRAPIQGWGQMVQEFFDPAHLKVENRALGGRSARTFIAEGRWEGVRSQAQAGDFILIQFGHNDSKSALSIDRYDLPGLGDETEDSPPNPRTGEKTPIRTFGYYMRKMVDEGVATGATVIVLSPVPRSKWSGGKIVRGEENHGEWAAAVAKEKGVRFVDVNATIADLYDPVGRPRIKALYFPQDNTHVNPAGARVNAAAVVSGLLALDNTAMLAAALQPNGREAVTAATASVASDAAAVKIPLPLATAFPKPNATGVNPDTPLRLLFTAPPTLGKQGKIRILDAATNAVVETIDVAKPVAQKSIGGLANFSYYPVIVSGLEATIFPRNGVLAYGKSYYVTIDAGVFRDDSSALAGVDASTAWHFTTKAAAPAAGSPRLTVAADGTGDFTTVQGALDSLPDGNTTPVTIFVKKGLYTEIVFFTNKHGITLLGEDRKETVLAYANNEIFNGNAGGNPFGSDHPDPASAPLVGGAIYHRGVLIGHHVNDFTVANLTLRNTTPSGGKQAEVIILNGTTTARAIIKDVDMYSFQDTMQVNGQAYFSGCHIEGDIDFMWGTGPSFFDHCTIRTLHSGAFYTQIRNPPTNHGFVYYQCTFDGARGVMGNFFSRVSLGRFPASEVVLLDCELSNAVGTTAWQSQFPYGDFSKAHFWEYNSHDAAGKPVDVSLRLPGSKQLTQPADAETIAAYSKAAFVLGSGWDPKSAPVFATAPAAAEPAPKAGAPIITVQPQSQLALLGTSPALTVAASGNAGRLSYQWKKNGHVISGASQPYLRLESVKMDDNAAYTVVVSNSAGSVTSEAAVVTATAPQSATTAPDLPRIPEASFDVTAYGAVGDGETDNTKAIQKTIDAASAAGGGYVVIPASARPYLSGPITLRHQIGLQVDKGATLQMLPYAASGNIPAFPKGPRAFIGGTGLHDIAVMGEGTINGDGDAWWEAFRASRRAGGGDIGRPWLVRVSGCERMLVANVTFTRSPMFHVAPSSTNHLTIFGIKIRSPENAPNTDGVDPSGSHHLVQNCDIYVGDDNVVMKPGGTFCSDITVADCEFGEGHGMSVGGQTNRGLDGMVVKNCTFDSTTTAIRLKADPTEGGPVKNITYTNLTMKNVPYPIVFYSYYNKVGNPAAVDGDKVTTPPEKVKEWNATPPNSLASKSLSSWKDITLSNITSTNTRGRSILFGLPLEGFFIDNLRFHNVRITGGSGFEIYDASNIQFSGDTDVGPLITCNALAITTQPKNQAIDSGGIATFTVSVAGTSGETDTPPSIQWTFEGKPVADGSRPDGARISGATTVMLRIENAQAAEAGKYAAVVSNTLDSYDVAAKHLVPGKTPVSATSAEATLSFGPPPTPVYQKKPSTRPAPSAP